MKGPFAIAAAQSSSVKGDVHENIKHHSQIAQLAASRGADIIVFPELSLTGYEPSIAMDKALVEEDEILRPLQSTADELNTALVVGCPVRALFEKPFIGALIVQPGQPIVTYCKRFLHPGEEEHFQQSRDSRVISVGEHIIGIAICADIDHIDHVTEARSRNADIYAAGVMMTPGGIETALSLMSSYASRFEILTVMANYGSATGGHPSAGQSTIWNDRAKIVAQAPKSGEFVLLARENDNGWVGDVIPI